MNYGLHSSKQKNCILTHFFNKKSALIGALLTIVGLFLDNTSQAQVYLYVNPSPQYFSVCQNSVGNSINSLLLAQDGDGFGFYFPGILTWSLSNPPLNGTVNASYSMTYVSDYVFPLGCYYTPAPGFTGTDVFTVELVDTFGNVDSTIINVTVYAPPSPIAGSPIVCIGGVTTLTDTALGGTWTSSNNAIATFGSTDGTLNGIAVGTVNVTYSTGCGTDVTKTETVITSSGSITGAGTVCVGSAVTLADAIPGGTWGSSAPSIATVSTGGVVTGLLAGTAIISYSTGCGADAFHTVTVNAVPVVGTITGVLSFCQTGVSTLSNVDAGGTWTSRNTAIATIGSTTGVATGIANGTDTITYTITNTCGTTSATTTITINPLPTVAAITGLSVLCPLTSITLAETTGGGTWVNSNNTLASISGSCVVSGLVAGIDTVSYSVTNSCGATAALHIITINPLPNAGYIYGAGGLCSSGTLTLTDAVSGGTWSSSNTAFATVAGGVVTGVSAGIDTISYTYTNSCGTNISKHLAIVGANPIITTIAGNGTGGFLADGVGATNAELFHPYGVAVDASGNMYIGDMNNHRIRKVSPAGIISTVAGTGTSGFGGDTGPATAATLHSPMGVAIDATGNLYFSDAQNNRIRKINTSGIISTIAGNGTPGFLGDGTSATGGELNNPIGVAVDGLGNLFVADYNNSRIRKINTSGIISTIAGSATVGYSGDGFAATLAALNLPTGVAVDAVGNVLIGGGNNNGVRMVNTAGIITTIAGSSTSGFSGDGFAATAATLNSPNGIAVDATGNIYVADQGNSRIRKIASGIITSVAGNGAPGFAGDWGIATAAQLYSPTGIALDANGNVYIADNINNVIREVSPVCECSGTPAAGTVVASDTNGCSTYTSVLSLTGNSNLPGISFQWQSSAGGVIFTNVAGATSYDYNATVTTPIYYRCIITCANGGLSATTPIIFLNEGLPTVSPITGPSSVCQGATITLVDTTTGGTWNTVGVANVTPGGIVTGLAGGVATISYSVTNSCGTVAATHIVTVLPAPAAGVITGTLSLCPSTFYTLSDTATGGTWVSASTGVVTITSGGVITVVSNGTSVISYTVTNGCGSATATTIVTVNPLPVVSSITGTAAICVGGNTTLSDTASGGTWTSANPSIANITFGSVIHGVSNGTTTITYSFTNVCGTAFATLPITVNPLPLAGTITGTLSVCFGSAATTLTDVAPGGTWSSSSTGVATVSSGGVVTAVGVGTTSIIYSVSNSCGTVTATAGYSVNALPVAGTIAGTLVLCAGANTTLTDTAIGGTWSSITPSVATIASGTGAVNALTTGTSLISYIVSNSCGTAYTTATVTVNPLPIAGTITGTTTVCSGVVSTFTDIAGGGTWSSTNPTVTTISTGGVDTAHLQGTTTISYTVSNSCGTVAATVIVTVNPLPVSGTITGINSVCVGSATSLSDVAPGGTWSSVSTGIATINPLGSVTGISAGTSLISYTVTNSCGTSVATTIVTVNPLPVSGSITGSNTVCAGSTDTLQDLATGGVWSNTNTADATISGTGVITAIAAGVSIVYYTVTNSCGTSVASTTVTVNPNPVAGIISGTAIVCVAANTTLTDAATGGIWSSFNTGVATVAGGIVTGVSAGSSLISYTVTNSCGTAYATINVTVNPLPYSGTITGSSSVCAGNLDTLLDFAIGGFWSSSNTIIAPISGSGVVNAISAGTTTIDFSVTNSCGTAVTSTIVTINPLPVAGSIVSAGIVCQASTITLTDIAAGGTWSSGSTGIATVAGGIVTGVAAGTAAITYTVTNICGTAIATTVVTVNPLPIVDSITGSNTVCIGATDTLHEIITSGTWSSSSPSIATIDTNGIVHAITTGTILISYTVTNSCGTIRTTKSITVNPLPTVTNITGTLFLCQSATVTLADAVSGGVWSSANTTIASVGSSTGVVSGIGGGTTTISYTLTTGCGVASTSKIVTINPLPIAGTISGSGIVCLGANITLTDTAAGGVWSSKNTTASVVGGIVTGNIAGIDTIVYTVTNGCGSVFTSHIININPYSGTITGASIVCEGSHISLTDLAVGGVWSSSSSTATVVGGIVTGITSGIDTISYTVTNSCGTAVATYPITINPLPHAGTITGASVICMGVTLTLTDTLPTGTWTSANTNIILSDSIITGVGAGTDTISYSVTNSCGTAVATFPISILPLANAGTITGPSAVCTGHTTTFTDSAIGGTWFISNSNATLDSGLVTGVTLGVDTIYYYASNSCSADTAMMIININIAPNAGTISGVSTLCAGNVIVLGDAVTGGVWLSSNNTLATVSGSGSVTSINAGIDSILYIFTNSCGSDTAFHPLTIIPIPTAGVITGPSMVCVGATISLTDAATGGSWTRTNTNASITGGIVVGLLSGTDTISYTVTNSCGTDFTTQTITINPQPYSGIIIGDSIVCVGSVIVLIDTTTGGSWYSSNTGLATISTGIVTGVAAGIDTIHYSVTNICGTAVSSHTVTINPLPNAGTIYGLSTVCTGNSITLADSATGGNWHISNANATNTGGIVTAISAGYDTLTYQVINSCGTKTVSVNITINPTPNAGTILGNDSVCAGNTTTLTNAATGGTWSSSNTGIAAVSSGGIVFGVAAGVDTIMYNVTNVCGTASTNAVILVETYPAVAISGITFTCVNKYDTLTAVPNNGTWSSRYPAIATVADSAIGGIVFGLSPGIDTILYTVVNQCGSSTLELKLTIYSTAQCPTGIANVGTNDNVLKVYPNPTDGNVNIELPELANNTSIIITDLFGKIVMEKNISTPNNKTQVDIKNVAKGTYLLKVVADGTIYREKITVW